MIFGLIAALIALRFVRSPPLLASVLGGLFLATALLLFMRNAERDYLMGLCLASVFSLSVAFFISRVPESIDRLRIRKG